MADRILMPLRTETGELKGYCGIATKAEQAPLLLFPRSLEARCKPTKPEPDELRKLFRVVWPFCEIGVDLRFRDA
jgi:hypothetical protein